eukprot:1153246-Pelagomonas_calceolata.AAC.3
MVWGSSRVVRLHSRVERWNSCRVRGWPVGAARMEGGSVRWTWGWPDGTAEGSEEGWWGQPGWRGEA